MISYDKILPQFFLNTSILINSNKTRKKGLSNAKKISSNTHCTKIQFENPANSKRFKNYSQVYLLNAKNIRDQHSYQKTNIEYFFWMLKIKEMFKIIVKMKLTKSGSEILSMNPS